MDDFGIHNLQMLAEKQNETSISIYMPTYPTDAEQNRIRFKNRYEVARKMVDEFEIGDAPAAEVLGSVGRLLDHQAFWQQQSDGLALFFSSEVFEAYRLPLAFEELVVITDRFHIKPLMPLVTSDTHFYVLALSQSRVRLFLCTRMGIKTLDLAGMPNGLDDALKYDDLEKQLQFHTGTGGFGGKRPAVFHGHGVGPDDAKKRILRYFRKIDRGLHGALHDEGYPLVLAGVNYILPIYREASSYPNLLEQTIPGNPDEMDKESLHKKAWALIEPHAKKAQKEAARKYRDLVGTGKTSKNLKEIISSAHHGRVGVLFIARDVQHWGRFDLASGMMEVHRTQGPGDEDLLNLAAVQTLIKGGDVYVVASDEIPDDALATALYRYP
jgi:hypothetical protein